MDECTVFDDGYYWLVTIDEMEMMLSIYNEDKVTFNSIVNRKKELDLEKSKWGRSLKQVLDESGIKDNKYLQLNKFEKYRIENIVQK